MQELSSSPALLEAHAQGLLLGLALGESAGMGRRRSVGELPVVAQVLVVAELLGAGADLEAVDLLGGWAAQQPQPHPGSITAEAVTLFQGGLPAEEVARAVARVIPDRAGDAPLTACLPIALACYRSGAAVKTRTLRLAAATHASPISQLAGVATALLARDLISWDLPDCLARVSQALRAEAPGELLSALRRPEPGAGIPEGDDAISLLAAAVHSLAEGGSWDASVAAATSRDHPGDRLPALVGALAGVRWGLGALPVQGRERLLPGLENRLLRLGAELVRSGPVTPPGRWGA